MKVIKVIGDETVFEAGLRQSLTQEARDMKEALRGKPETKAERLEREKKEKEKKENEQREFDATVKSVTDLLASRGITMSIGACGCCNSPWVKIKCDDVDIDYDNFTFDMFE